jgi:hypothetical protein
MVNGLPTISTTIAATIAICSNPELNIQIAHKATQPPRKVNYGEHTSTCSGVDKWQVSISYQIAMKLLNMKTKLAIVILEAVGMELTLQKFTV